MASQFLRPGYAEMFYRTKDVDFLYRRSQRVGLLLDKH